MNAPTNTRIVSFEGNFSQNTSRNNNNNNNNSPNDNLPFKIDERIDLFELVPDEVIWKVFLVLNHPETYRSLLQVNRRFYDILKEEAFWKLLCQTYCIDYVATFEAVFHLKFPGDDVTHLTGSLQINLEDLKIYFNKFGGPYDEMSTWQKQLFAKVYHFQVLHEMGESTKEEEFFDTMFVSQKKFLDPPPAFTCGHLTVNTKTETLKSRISGKKKSAKDFYFLVSGSFSLTGVWSANYECGADPEEFHIVHYGFKVFCLKSSGDAFVPTGKPSWSFVFPGRITANVCVPGAVHLATYGYAQQSWGTSLLTVIDEDTLHLMEPTKLVKFTRKKPKQLSRRFSSEFDLTKRN